MRLFSTTLCLIVFSASIAQACSCRQPPPPKQALKVAAAVFQGKVTKVESTERSLVKVTFTISRTWKGTKGKSISVLTSSSGASCGYNFEKGKSYLVYCYQPKRSGKKSVALHVSLCSRTKSLKSAKSDLKELGEGKKPKSESTARSDQCRLVWLKSVEFD